MKKRVRIMFMMLVLIFQMTICIIGGFILGVHKGREIGIKQVEDTYATSIQQVKDTCATKCTTICCSAVYRIFGYENECPLEIETETETDADDRKEETMPEPQQIPEGVIPL
jgi:hypothetical protein